MAINQKTGEVYDDYDPFLDDLETDPEKLARQVANENKQLTVQEEEEQEVTIFRKEVPEYLIRLNELQLDRHEKAALLSVYDSPVDIRSFKAFVNREVTLYGGIIWHHDDTKSKETGEFKAGWDEVRFLSIDADGNPFIIKASYGSLANHVRGMLGLYGWFMWEEPVTYLFGQDEKTNGFRLVNQDRVKALLGKMRKTGKK